MADENITCALTLLPNDSPAVLFKTPFEEHCTPHPFPEEYVDKWDIDHVHMPCSPKNKLNENTTELSQCGWIIICASLDRPIQTSLELEKAIMQYNPQYVGRWDFRGLHSFFDKHFDPSLKTQFFQHVLPGMIDLAQHLPDTCTQPIPLLNKCRDHSITISQKQIACLLTNAFLCTFPKRKEFSKAQLQRKWDGHYSTYPSINFDKLYVGIKGDICQRNREKLKCLFNYFARIIKKEPIGTVTFHRQYLEEFPDWASSNKKIRKISVHCNGYIEKEGYGMLQVDFADQLIGGLVLDHGCVQEEIRFVICPELIVARLFTESLDDKEAVIITGVEQYSKYTGYADTFLFDGDFKDNTPRDSWGRRKTSVVAMDALHFRSSSDQLKLPLIKRELNKAFVGFFGGNSPSSNLPAVATGNWGCGVFKGLPHLKFLIQLMAASEAERDFVYFTFGNQNLYDDFDEMKFFIANKNLTVGNIWSILELYSTEFQKTRKHRPNLFKYFYSACSNDSSAEPE